MEADENQDDVEILEDEIQLLNVIVHPVPENQQDNIIRAENVENQPIDDDFCEIIEETVEQNAYPSALESVSANPAYDTSKQVSAGEPGMYQSSGEMPSGSKHHHQPTMTSPVPSPQPSPIVNPSQQLDRHVAIPQNTYPSAQQSVSANPAHDMSKQVSAGQPGMYQSSGEMPSGSKHHHQPTMTGPAPSPQPSPVMNPSQQLDRHVSIPQNTYPSAQQTVSANPAHDMSKQVSAGQPGMYQSSGEMPTGTKHHLQPTMTGPAPSPQPSPIVNPSQQLDRNVAIPQNTYPSAQQTVSANPAHEMSKQVSAGQPGMYQSYGEMPTGTKHHHQPTMTSPAPSPQPSPIVNPSQQLDRHVAIPVEKLTRCLEQFHFADLDSCCNVYRAKLVTYVTVLYQRADSVQQPPKTVWGKRSM